MIFIQSASVYIYICLMQSEIFLKWSLNTILFALILYLHIIKANGKRVKEFHALLYSVYLIFMHYYGLWSCILHWTVIYIYI